MRWFLIGVVLLGACSGAKPVRHDGAPVTRTATPGSLDSLPRLGLSDGRLVCLAVNAAPCPAGLATANWLHDGKFATWEMHKPAYVWSPNSPNPQLLGEVGKADSQFDIALSVAATPTGYTVLSLSNQRALFYDVNGHYKASLPMPPASLARARGFSGDISFLQLVYEDPKDSLAAFEVRLVDGPGDTAGVTVLKSKLDWMRIHNDKFSAPLPLFPTLPSYGFAVDSDIIWSRGEKFNLERRTPAGALRWSLTTDATGPALTEDQVKALRLQVPATDKARLASFDSSAAHSGKFLSAISGLLIAPDDRVLVAGSQGPARDSVDFYVIGATGEPFGRFTLARRTHPLLFGGDSVLVQRPGANAQQETRWLVIKKP